MDYGNNRRRTIYGRFTRHPVEEVEGRLVLAVLNFRPNMIGPVVSEALMAQYPKAETGEAAFVSPSVGARRVRR